MKKLKLIFALMAVFCVSGCGGVASPASATLFYKTKGPVAVGPAMTSTKEGRSKATQVLIFAFGDASIQKAMKNGGITSISTVDHESVGFLGLFGKYTTIVRGE